MFTFSLRNKCSGGAINILGDVGIEWKIFTGVRLTPFGAYEAILYSHDTPVHNCILRAVIGEMYWPIS